MFLTMWIQVFTSATSAMCHFDTAGRFGSLAGALATSEPLATLNANRALSAGGKREHRECIERKNESAREPELAVASGSPNGA